MQEGEIMRESHSLSFTDSQGNTKNTFTDYHLIAKGKPSIDPPEVQTEYVEILGRNGLLDMTGGVDGVVRFKNMAATWSFIVDPRFDYYAVYKKLLNELHGQKFSIVLVDDDPSETYIGRLTIASSNLGEHFNEITITANIDPNLNGSNIGPSITKISVDSSKLVVRQQYAW